jgi:hypothetical protein
MLVTKLRGRGDRSQTAVKHQQVFLSLLGKDVNCFTDYNSVAHCWLR